MALHVNVAPRLTWAAWAREEYEAGRLEVEEFEEIVGEALARGDPLWSPQPGGLCPEPYMPPLERIRKGI